MNLSFGVHSAFLICGLMSFAKFRISAYFFEDFFSTSPPLLLLGWQLYEYWVFFCHFHIGEALFIYYIFSIFPICCLDWINSIIMSSGSLILFSLNSILQFSLSSEIKKNLLFFISMISICFFFIVSIC